MLLCDNLYRPIPKTAASVSLPSAYLLPSHLAACGPSSLFTHLTHYTHGNWRRRRLWGSAIVQHDSGQAACLSPVRWDFGRTGRLLVCSVFLLSSSMYVKSEKELPPFLPSSPCSAHFLSLSASINPSSLVSCMPCGLNWITLLPCPMHFAGAVAGRHGHGTHTLHTTKTRLEWWEREEGEGDRLPFWGGRTLGTLALDGQAASHLIVPPLPSIYICPFFGGSFILFWSFRIQSGSRIQDSFSSSLRILTPF